MNTRHLKAWYVRRLLLGGLLLLGIGAYAGFYLYGQISDANQALQGNLARRRAAADLAENSIDLVGLLRSGVDRVDFIHDRITKHLQEIRRASSLTGDQGIVDQLEASFDRYFEIFHGVEGSKNDRDARLQAAATYLESQTLPLCQAVVEQARLQMRQSEETYRRAMRWLAWGIAAVGLLAATAGLLFGYGVARTLSRTIRHLQIRLQDAAGKIGPDLPEIVVEGDGDLTRLEGQIQELMTRVESLVQRLQQREREVLRAEQLSAVGQLAAGVAHEIRNPLTSIKMLVQAGREDSAGLPPEDLEIIELEALRMEKSLKVFLDFARLPKPERAEQDMAAIASRTLDLIRGRAIKQRVDLHLSGPDEPVLIEADGGQLQQVLVNLSLNALDVMPFGGKLQIIIRPLPQGVEIVVKDTGPGIAPELMPRLFEPFVSTKETGLGLGLVISRRIVEEHDGRLRAGNLAEGGACFVIELPNGKSTSGVNRQKSLLAGKR